MSFLARHGEQGTGIPHSGGRLNPFWRGPHVLGGPCGKCLVSACAGIETIIPHEIRIAILTIIGISQTKLEHEFIGCFLQCIQVGHMQVAYPTECPDRSTQARASCSTTP